MNSRTLDEKSIFLQAIEIRSATERSSYLDVACGDDQRLRQEIEALLDAHEWPIGLLDAPNHGPSSADRSPVVEQPGSTIGPYKLLEVVGEGGMGVVYMAEQMAPVRRRVALKIIKPGMDTKQVVARFEAERQALALMDHPNIARVHDAGATDSGRPYFVMELIRGIALTDYCDREQLPIAERLELFVLVCRAVQHAHQKGVIHRDLKPSNVLVTVIDGVAVPKVIDFGVAKATGRALTERTLFTGLHQFLGSPLYMSPEQADLAGVDVDTRSDIYAMGVLLYELLTGTTPFDGESLHKAAFDEMRRMIREEEPPKPSARLSTLEDARQSSISGRRRTVPRHLVRVVRGELDWVVMKALEKDRRRRYETANDFAADVLRYLTDRPVEACPPSARYRFSKYARRNRATLTTAALIGLALVAGTAVSTWQAVRATRAGRLMSAALAEASERRIEAQGKADETQAVLDFLINDMLASAAPDRHLGRKLTVEDVLEDATRALDGRFAENPATEAAIRHAIGTIRIKRDQYEKANPLFRRALELRREHLGPEHADTLRTMIRLAQSFRAAHHSDPALIAEAEALARPAAEGLRRALGPRHPDTLYATLILAHYLHFQGKDIDAEAMFVQVLRVAREALGPDHEYTLDALNALGNFYALEQQHERARPLLEQAVAAKRRAHGPNHPSLLWSLLCLRGSLQGNGKYSTALPVCEEAMDIGYRILGPSASWTGIALGGLTELHALLGTKEDLRAFHRRYVLWLEGRGGLKNDANSYPLPAGVHADALRLLVHYQLLNAREVLDPALCIEAAAKAVELAPGDSANHLTLAWAYTAAERWDDAEKALKEAGKHRPADEVPGMETFVLAMIRHGQGDIERARALYREGVAARSQRGPGNWTYDRLRPQLEAMFGTEVPSRP